MIIRKYLHSCLLVEEKGKRLLIDPGAFSFVEKKLKPEDLGPVDAILLTHKHPDHYFPEALKALHRMRPARIICSDEIGALLKQDGLPCEPIKPGGKMEVAGFKVEAFDAPHGELPVEVPHNMAYFINGKLVHPGDSFEARPPKGCEVLALPIAGPWATVKAAMDFARSLKPKHVIPIHDAIIKDFMLERMYDLMLKPSLEKAGIAFHPLGLGEALEV